MTSHAYADEALDETPERPARPTSVMVVAILFVPWGLLSALGSAQTASESNGALYAIAGANVFLGFAMTLAGFLLLAGLRFGWYAATGVALLQLVSQVISLTLLLALATRVDPRIGGLAVVLGMVSTFVSVLVLMILANPKARASFGV